MRRQRSHVKLVALGYWQGGRVWVVGLELGQAYADVRARRRRARTCWVRGWVLVCGCGGMFVLWNMVGLVQVLGDGSFLCWLWVWGVCAIFSEHPQ